MPSAAEPAALSENAHQEPGEDPRLRLLGACVARSLRPAAGAWERCARTAEAEQLLHAFLGRDAAEGPRPLLVVRPGPGGLALCPGLDAGPESGPPRAKGLFFLRTRPEPPGPYSLRGAVLCGDVPAAPLEHLAALFSEVRVVVTLPGLRPGTGGAEGPWAEPGPAGRGPRGGAGPWRAWTPAEFESGKGDGWERRWVSTQTQGCHLRGELGESEEGQVGVRLRDPPLGAVRGRVQAEARGVRAKSCWAWPLFKAPYLNLL